MHVNYYYSDYKVNVDFFLECKYTILKLHYAEFTKFNTHYMICKDGSVFKYS